jgi:uncharacterized protein YdaU (DUF1376 family)
LASDLPYMPFWPKDWLQSTATLTVEQRDAYMTLLCHAWEEGGLPTNEDKLRNIGRWTPAAWRRIWEAVGERFEVRNGRLIHPRMELERTGVRERHDKLSSAGKAGAAGRWRGHTRGQSDRNATASRPDWQSDLDPEVHLPPTPSAPRKGRQTRAERKAALRAVGPSRQTWREDCEAAGHRPPCSTPAEHARATAKAEHPEDVSA